jgi:hypothetical protein
LNVATFAGFIPAAPDQEILHIVVTSNFDDYDADYYPFKFLDGALDPGANVRTVNLPVSQQANTRAGDLAGSFGVLDWYDRIHVVPANLSLGNLVSVEERNVEVWNAYSSSQLLSSITATGDEGLVLTGPTSKTYGPLESVVYVLNVDIGGPPTIDALYTFNFPGQAPTLNVTASRVIGFAFRPNWIEPIIERLQWRTDILTARDGSEQRISLRSIPRREFEFSTITQAAQAARADALLWGWGARVFALPIWTDPHVLTTQLSAGSTSIPVPTQYRGYAADSLAVLWLDDFTYEFVDVQSVGANSITLERPIGGTWPAGTKVMPARLARLADRARSIRHTATVAETVRMLWRIEPMQPLGGIEGPAPTQYQGQDVYLLQPNRVDALEDEASRVAEWIDFETGPITVDDPVNRPEIVRDYAWLLNGRQQISNFKQFVTERRGRWKPVYIPTWQRDIELVQILGAGATVMTITDIGYRSYYAGTPGRRDIAISLPDGTLALRRIVSWDQVVSGQERITIDSGLPVQLDPGAYITLMGLHRLDADQIEIAWHSAEVAEAKTRLKLVAS